MNAWSIALTNLTVIPKDERLTCKVCGDKFSSGSRLEREAAQRAKERKRAMSCV